MHVLVTGGAGFIGTYLTNGLVEAGHQVVVLDNLDPEIHAAKPRMLNPAVTYVWKDIRDRAAVRQASSGADALVHLAALIEIETGEREMGRYFDVNVRGTATLLDTLLSTVDSMDRLVLASSVAIYGEGSYVCPEHGSVRAESRTQEQLARQEWEVRCPRTDAVLEPLATSEEKPPNPGSFYGLTKLVQEKLFEGAARERGVPAVVLRLGNVFGPGQRPGAYTGVTTTFLRRLQQGEPPVIHEDGQQTRDFVFVDDVVRATLLALEADIDGSRILNIGSGKPVSVLEVADAVAEVKGMSLPPSIPIPGTFRQGDVRHLWLDVTKAREVLGFESSIGLREGLRRMLAASKES